MDGAIAHAKADELRAALSGSLRTPGGADVDVPAGTREALLRVIDVLESSRDIAVFAVDELLSTQRVAELLGVSRMTVTRIIDRGELAASGAGVHRRVAVADVQRYRRDRADRRSEAVRMLAGDVDDELSPDRVVPTR